MLWMISLAKEIYMTNFLYCPSQAYMHNIYDNNNMYELYVRHSFIK